MWNPAGGLAPLATMPRPPLVRSGALRYVLLELPPRSQASRQRARWVRSHCTRVESPEAQQPFVGENGADQGGNSGLYRCAVSDRR